MCVCVCVILSTMLKYMCRYMFIIGGDNFGLDEHIYEEEHGHCGRVWEDTCIRTSFSKWSHPAVNWAC